MANQVEEFNAYRSKMNEKMMADDNKIVKRIFNLDTNAFAEGALPKKTKELLGLGNSLVLRCDDCVKYHLEACYKLNIPCSSIRVNIIGSPLYYLTFNCDYRFIF